MELTRELNIPGTYFYQKIIDSVIYDIFKATGETVSKDQLDGYEYVKEFSKNNRAKIKIEKVVPNEAYYFRTSTTRNDFLVQYEIVCLSDTSCQVKYQETMKSFGVLQQLNDLVIGTLLMYLKKRQFKRMLGLIEQSY
ncbi:DUF3284 domain-containing protein [Vagococcus humatus]|uniref:DUF3284 domain-containing protein n=1 Tax=Vagococcus humatus TaxID=1889241 RepID=A0A3R9YFR9_9ENTE|nr:DUF3284 domain-containing protein [Vagococcus humatus]RST90125.1 hypothetical protein C7P63_03335 [Vagococcus humatus]